MANPVCGKCGQGFDQWWGQGEPDRDICLNCYKKSKSCYLCGKFNAEGLQNGRCAECRKNIEDVRKELEEPAPKPDEGVQHVNGESPEKLLNLYSKTDEDGNEARLVVQKMSNIRAERIDWVWPGKLPLGMFSIFCGRMGSGKGLTWVDIVARLTTGRDWPDGAANSLGPQMALVVCSEDDPNRVLRPRLEAAGANLDKVIWLKLTEKTETVKQKATKRQRQLIIDRDLDLLGGALARHPQIKLVVLDPLSSFVSVKITDDKEIRPVMDLITKMCAISGAALLAVSHTNKRSDVDSTQRVLGASSVAGAARIIWSLALNPDDKEERLLSLVKSNIGNTKGQKFRVAVEKVRLEDGTETEAPRCEWLGDHDEDADEVMDKQKQRSKDGGEDSKLVLAKAWLQQKFRESWEHKCTALYSEAKDSEGISDKTLKRAMNQLRDGGLLQIEVDDRRTSGRGYWWTVRRPEDRAISYQEIM